MKIIKQLFFPLFALMITQSSTAACNTAKPDSKKIDVISSQGYKYDTFATKEGGTVDLVFIKHGSLMVNVDDYLIYVDPVTMFGNDFSVLPKADMILVTHEHHDHYDKDAITTLSDNHTLQVLSQKVAELKGDGKGISPGQSVNINNEHQTFSVTAVPAYNISPGHENFHPKERNDVGFVFDIDGLKIYVAGDTEDIPEMSDLEDVDIVFLPINQPYTMTPQQAAHAIDMLISARKEKTSNKLIFYPYHYGDTDLTPLIDKYKESNDVEIRVRQMQ